MERVAIYDRSCTGDVSITVERLKSFAEQNGLTVTEIYKDERYSGLNENRPAYRKMLLDAGLGKYDKGRFENFKKYYNVPESKKIFGRKGYKNIRLRIRRLSGRCYK